MRILRLQVLKADGLDTIVLHRHGGRLSVVVEPGRRLDGARCGSGLGDRLGSTGLARLVRMERGPARRRRRSRLFGNRLGRGGRRRRSLGGGSIGLNGRGLRSEEIHLWEG